MVIELRQHLGPFGDDLIKLLGAIGLNLILLGLMLIPLNLGLPDPDHSLDTLEHLLQELIFLLEFFDFGVAL